MPMLDIPRAVVAASPLLHWLHRQLTRTQVTFSAIIARASGTSVNVNDAAILELL